MRKILFILPLVIIFTACRDTPKGVIDESDMKDVLVDLYKAEAAIELNPTSYYNDSLKMELKQAVLKKHGYTIEELDSTISWYAHNVERYDRVYQEVIMQLEQEKESAKTESSSKPATTTLALVQGSRKRYTTKGDTIDLWSKCRQWQFLPGLKSNDIYFQTSLDPTTSSPGDQYKLSFKLTNNHNPLYLLLAIDYMDGSTAYVSTNTYVDGWNTYMLQSDTLRTVSRVYGYMKYKPQYREVCYIDSIELLKSHLNRTMYGVMKSHKWVGRGKQFLDE